MKVAANRSEAFCRNPDHSINLFLLYGSDKGMVRDHLRFIIKAYKGRANTNLAVTKLAIEEVRSNLSLLYDEVLGFSLLAEQRLITIEEVTDTDKTLVQSLLEDSSKLTAPLVMLAGSLTAKSQLRKLCEKHDAVAAIPAYADDQRSLPNFVRTFFQENNKMISQDAVFFLSQQLGVDRGVTRQELDKILTFAGDKASIELEDVQALSASESGFFLDDLLYAVFDGKVHDVERLYSLAVENAVQPSIIVQQLSKHALRLHGVKALVEQGTAVDRAIMMTGGPLFWKVGDRFKQQARTWQLGQLLDTFTKLAEATKQSRSNLGVDEALCHRALLSVAAQSPLRRR